jgi:hypothetical protein
MTGAPLAWLMARGRALDASRTSTLTIEEFAHVLPA